MVAAGSWADSGIFCRFCLSARGVEPGLAPFSRGQDTVVPDTEPAGWNKPICAGPDRAYPFLYSYVGIRVSGVSAIL